MLKKFVELICGTPSEKSSETSDEYRAQLAAASLLFQLAYSDHSVDPSEREAIKASVSQLSGLNQKDIAQLVEDAENSANQATSLFEFTDFINEQFDEDKKLRILEYLWDVAHADKHVHKYEEHFIRRVSDLLNLHHDGFIKTKLRSQHKLTANAANSMKH